MFGISFSEVLLIVIVGLIVFVPGKLPEVARTIGKGMREFRRASAALQQAINEPVETAAKVATQPHETQPQPAQTASTQPAAQPAAAPAQPTAASTAQPAVTAQSVPHQPAPSDTPTQAAAYQPPTQESVKAELAAQQDKVQETPKQV